MGLRSLLIHDLDNVFMNPDDWATIRQFRIGDGRGGFKVFVCPVVWDEEAAKIMLAVTRFGIYRGEVMLMIMHRYLPRSPIAGELIYSPANSPYEVIDCTDQEYMWVASLSSTRSLPAKFGSN